MQFLKATADKRFAIVDAVVDLPNVQSFVFREHEGSFLVGMMAALASKTGKVGFVGGMDIPLIRKFQCGYEQGPRPSAPVWIPVCKAISRNKSAFAASKASR